MSPKLLKVNRFLMVTFTVSVLGGHTSLGSRFHYQSVARKKDSQSLPPVPEGLTYDSVMANSARLHWRQLPSISCNNSMEMREDLVSSQLENNKIRSFIIDIVEGSSKRLESVYVSETRVSSSHSHVYEIKELKSSTFYTISIAGTNKCGIGPYSHKIRFKTKTFDSSEVVEVIVVAIVSFAAVFVLYLIMIFILGRIIRCCRHVNTNDYSNTVFGLSRVTRLRESKTKIADGTGFLNPHCRDEKSNYDRESELSGEALAIQLNSQYDVDEEEKLRKESSSNTLRSSGAKSNSSSIDHREAKNDKPLQSVKIDLTLNPMLKNAWCNEFKEIHECKRSSSCLSSGLVLNVQRGTLTKIPLCVPNDSRPLVL